VAVLRDHLNTVVRAFADGDVVPFFGAGVSRFGRGTEPWERGHYLPDGSELAQYLADRFAYGEPDVKNLPRVSQYVHTSRGEAPLYRELREVISEPAYAPTPVHEFFAALPGRLAAKNLPDRHLLVVTTNYDNLLEQAFAAAGEPYDLLVYAPDEQGNWAFVSVSADGAAPASRRISDPTSEAGFTLDERSVIVKVHGGLDGKDSRCVLTEDDYVDYLAYGDLLRQLPVNVAGTLRASNLLFLGYGIADWNIRAFLRRVQREQRGGWTSWAVQKDPLEFDQRLWSARKVQIYDVDIAEYLAGLERALKGFRGPARR